MANRKEIDPLERSTKSFTCKVPQLGDNVIRTARQIRICKNLGCARPVIISKVYVRSGCDEYSCPTHGVRNLAQMKWMDITGSTTLEFRKVGLHE